MRDTYARSESSNASVQTGSKAGSSNELVVCETGCDKLADTRATLPSQKCLDTFEFG